MANAATVLAELLCTDHKVDEERIRDTGADKVMLEQFWMAMRPHVAHMRGFKPLSDVLGEVRGSTGKSLSLSMHVLKIAGEYHRPRLFITRRGSLLITAYDSQGKALTCPADTRYIEVFVNSLIACDGFTEPGNGASLHLWLMRRLAEAWRRSLELEEADLKHRLSVLSTSAAVLSSVNPINLHP